MGRGCGLPATALVFAEWHTSCASPREPTRDVHHSLRLVEPRPDGAAHPGVRLCREALPECSMRDGVGGEPGPPLGIRRHTHLAPGRGASQPAVVGRALVQGLPNLAQLVKEPGGIIQMVENPTPREPKANRARRTDACPAPRAEALGFGSGVAALREGMHRTAQGRLSLIGG